MSKTCFVIMPFGSNDPELKKRFDGVYKGIITPAVIEAGYIPVREDFSAAPGSITKSIVTKLAESDMVIADLTNMNPNVFYELGIRHVFSKSGTVLIIQKKEKIPFNNAGLRVIEYTGELDDLDDIHKQIIKAIQLRESDASKSDNTVHDTFPRLPMRLQVDASDSVNDELRKKISDLTRSNQALQQVVDDHGLSEASTKILQQKTVKERMRDARYALGNSGKNVIVKLHEYAAKEGEGAIDGFTECLEAALEAGYMTENDYINIKEICDQMGYLPLEIAVMEHAYEVFPEEESIIRNLSDVYTKMPSTDVKQKGVALIEDLLGIKKKDGKYYAEHLKHASPQNIAALFNAYTRMNYHDRSISVSEFYETSALPQSTTSLIMRNKASAFSELKEVEKAKTTFEALLDMDYYDDTNHGFYASFLADNGDYPGAYREEEIAAILDRSDSSRFINLAIEILNHHYIRTSADSLTRTQNSAEQIDAIMPLFLYAIEMGGHSQAIRTRVAEILYRRNQMGLAQAVMAKTKIDRSEFNCYPLDYILNADIEKIKNTPAD